MTKFTAPERAKLARQMYILEKNGRREVRPCSKCGAQREPVSHSYRSIADLYNDKGISVSEALVATMIDEYRAYHDLITRNDTGAGC
jgi:hypothetical protein